jgi:hypothetical protein
MKLRNLWLWPALAIAAASAACGDPTGLKATLETVQDTLVVFALNGTAPLAPTALNTPTHTVVQADPASGFDVAFDVNEAGQAVIYPLKLVDSEFGTVRPVGLLKVAGAYESVLSAPSSGYGYDSALVALPGEVVVVQAQGQPFCNLDPITTVYSKLTVDSVDTSSRTVHFRMTVDPNCGFRSFAPGVPDK